MFDWLISIPGPTFLVYYFIYVVIVIAIGTVFSFFDSTGKMDEPGISELEKYHIAALRGGGSGEVVITAAFSLWHKGLITINDDKIKRSQKKVPILDPVEKVVYDELQSPMKASDLRYSPGVRRVDVYLDSINNNLIKLHLKPDKKLTTRNWTIFCAVVAAILILGGMKLYFGLQRDKPVTFLVMIMVFSLFAAFLLLQPIVRYQTTLGRRYLKSLASHYSRIKKFSPMDNLRFNIDPALEMAVFGTAALYSDTRLTAFTRAFTPPQSSDGGGGGFGCGGGGCGGGGCGGCGG